MLLTRPPLEPKSSLDLHVLSLPPAFVLSQDQTLKLKRRSRDVLDVRTSAHPLLVLPAIAYLRTIPDPPTRLGMAQAKSHLSDAHQFHKETEVHTNSEADTPYHRSRATGYRLLERAP